MSGWIQIAEFSSDAEAYIAAGMLRSHGIDAVVGADRMSTLYGSGLTWAPITLSVPGEQADEAIKLLKKDT